MQSKRTLNHKRRYLLHLCWLGLLFVLAVLRTDLGSAAVFVKPAVAACYFALIVWLATK